MNRRKFVSALGRSGLAVAAVSVAAATVSKGRDIIGQSADGISGSMDALKKRVDALEEDQKNYLRALCVITAISTGIDLSILI